MGKKRRLLTKLSKLGKKYAAHPLLQSLKKETTDAETPELPAVEEEPIVEEDPIIEEKVVLKKAVTKKKKSGRTKKKTTAKKD